MLSLSPIVYVWVCPAPQIFFKVKNQFSERGKDLEEQYETISDTESRYDINKGNKEIRSFSVIR